jgi:hypothetical protein
MRSRCLALAQQSFSRKMSETAQTNGERNQKTMSSKCEPEDDIQRSYFDDLASVVSQAEIRTLLEPSAPVAAQPRAGLAILVEASTRSSEVDTLIEDDVEDELYTPNEPSERTRYSPSYSPWLSERDLFADSEEDDFEVAGVWKKVPAVLL